MTAKITKEDLETAVDVSRERVGWSDVLTIEGRKLDDNGEWIENGSVALNDEQAAFLYRAIEFLGMHMGE